MKGLAPRTHLALTVALCVAAGALLLGADGDAADAFGWVGLGGVLGIAASRGRTRIPVGAALAVAGLCAREEHLAGGVLLAAAGIQVMVLGARWPALGARYEAPGGPRRTDADVWDALDRGEDPTA